MIKNLVIRFAQKADVKRLIELCKLHAAFEESPYDLKGKEQLLSVSLFQASPPLHCLVAVVNEKTVGYATYMKQYATWDAGFYVYMDCIFLTNESRGLGIGQMLTERIKKEGRKLGCDIVQWQTPDFNKRAIKFYYRIGATSKSKERFFLAID